MKKRDNSKEKKSPVIFDLIALGSVAGYLVVDFLPNFNRGEYATPQFLYLNILNIVVAALIAYFPQLRAGFDFLNFKKQPLLLVYVLFVLLCGFSVLTAINQSLALVSLSRILVVSVMVLNLTVLFCNRLHLIYTVCLIIGTAGLMQVTNVLAKLDFSAEWSVLSRSMNIHLKGNTGNINIFSASLLYKIPFILIGIWHYGSRLQGLWLSLALLLTTTGVLFINARASLLALIAILLVFTAYHTITQWNNKRYLFRGVSIILPLILAFLWVNLVRQEAADNRYGKSAIERLQDISTEDSGAKARFLFWENALKIAQKKPLMGIGLGNWRIESIAYEPPVRSNISLNTHNDYLEIMAETGILNGLVYLTVFVLLLFFNLKQLLKGNSTEKKTLALIALLLLIVYGNDAFFNFPLYRPTMQVAFALLLAISLINLPRKTGGSANMSLLQTILLVAIALLPAYVSYQSDRTMLLETRIQRDPVTKNIKATPAMKASEIEEHTPKWPNVLMSSTGSFAEYAGVLYYKEKDYENAKRSFELANEINPNLGKADYYKYLMAMSEKKPDSAYLFIKSSFYRRARDFEIYQVLLNMAIAHRDSSEIIKAYRHYNNIHHQPRALAESARSLIRINAETKMVLDFIEEEKQGFMTVEDPKTDSIFSDLYNRIGQQFFSKNQRAEAYSLYQKGLELSPDNPELMFRIGLYYVGEQNFHQAVQWLSNAAKNTTGLLKDNGELEQTLALCYIVIGDQALACQFFTIAESKKNPAATASKAKYCR